MKHKYIGSRADYLGNGQPIAPGEVLDDVDLKDENNQRLKEEGLLIEVPEQKSKPPEPKAEVKEGGSK